MHRLNAYSDRLHSLPGPPGGAGAADARDATDASAPERIDSGRPEPNGSAAERAPVPPGFDALYSEHFDFVCRSLRLLGVAPDGLEDSAQDVFGVVSRRLAEFVPNAPVRTWLFAIVQRVAANQRRTQRRKRAPLEPLCEPLVAHEPGPDAHAEAAQAAELIARFADGLDDGHRAVLVLALIERLSVREVATALGIPLFTVYSRIRSVRSALKAFLQAREVEP
ncbi:MAG TPA: RNA polymerase sigma factor [Polyangiaceae bacterium]|nr:RNA polymerase sigma factor [Polyangiaceae bacterium]